MGHVLCVLPHLLLQVLYETRILYETRMRKSSEGRWAASSRCRGTAGILKQMLQTQLPSPPRSPWGQGPEDSPVLLTLPAPEAPVLAGSLSLCGGRWLLTGQLQAAEWQGGKCRSQALCLDPAAWPSLGPLAEESTGVPGTEVRKGPQSASGGGRDVPGTRLLLC